MNTPEDRPASLRVRRSDALLAILFGTLILLVDEQHATAIRAVLLGLAVLQLIEGRVPLLRTSTGRMASVFLQLALSFELMHLTGDAASPYYPILLLPVVSTATILGAIATAIASVAAVATLLSFLLLYDWKHVEMAPDGWHILEIRCLLMAATAVLVNALGQAIRLESARNKATAEKLAIANENLLAAEAAMRRAERLAALGQLTAGLAHELRNPLASIKGSADLLARTSGDRDTMARELGEIISSEVNRTNLLVTRFLDFARPLEPRREVADITEVIDSAAKRAGVQIVRDYSKEVPRLSIDAALMEQVFINLLTNAAQASEPHDPVTVITRMEPGSHDQCVEINVTDHGCGIAPDKIETIFNPFVTTKQDGVGLGLAIVTKIIDGHGGKMTVDSEPGKGSTFRIVLPHLKMKKRILVVEDEDKLRRIVELQLLDAGFEVDKAAKAEEALPLIDRADLILTDYKLPGMTGLEMLQIIRRQNTMVPVIMMTAFGTIENAVEAMKAGAADFLPKPFSLEHLTTVVNKALEVRSLRDENFRLKEELGKKYNWDNIVGHSAAMQKIFSDVMRVAPSGTTILLAGESGVGKDLIARAIHYHSPRRDRPFVKINCTALPENLMESELFGYEKGAFTGANMSKPGKFEQADTGTVMLDEIGDVPGNIQVKLLRVLQEREVERLGSNKTLHINVRVIAATNRDLRAALEDGTFREDLYYRLNVVPIEIPPLRERREDIPYLVRFFVNKLAKENGGHVHSITDAAIEKLMQYSWPGNVREIENVIERSIVMTTGDNLDADDIRLDMNLRPRAQAGEMGLPEGMSLDAYEQELIRNALKQANNNKSQAARILGLTRNSLRYRLTQMGIES